MTDKNATPLPSVCDGKEQYAFEEWAKSEGYEMEEHPLHYIFMDQRTAAARYGWKAALRYVEKVSAANRRDYKSWAAFFGIIAAWVLFVWWQTGFRH